MKEMEIDGINHNHILTNPIVNALLKSETMGHITHEQALCGMVNALADRNAELEKIISDICDSIPIMPPMSVAEITQKLKICEGLTALKGRKA